METNRMETYYGHVRTPADAIILFEACRIGLVPRVQRRLSEKERQAIRSGSVFVWDEREAGMRRWTDGKSWSASRVSGSFLTYREMEGKRGSGSVSMSRGGKTPESARGSDDDRGTGEVDDGPDGYRYKPDGLMKQSFSITTSAGQHLHLISYYARSDPAAPSLRQPSTDPALRHVRPQKGLYPESTVNDQQNLPVVTRGPMAGAAYSITPHPIGPYVRPGATHPQSYSPPYPWPPTPMATPPTVAVPYGSPYHLPPVPGPNGQPYAQYPLLPPAQAGLPAPYDRPTNAADAALPQSISHSNAHPPSFSMYAHRSPRAIGEPLDLRRQQSPGYSQRINVSPQTPSYRQPIPPASNGFHGMTAHGGSPRIRSQPPPPPPPYSRVFVPLSANPDLAAHTELRHVPSVGLMVNSAPQLAGSTLATVPPPPPPPPPPLSSNPRFSLSGSDGIPRISEGPRDIPSEKLLYGVEDKRALRQLDRVFTA